MYWIHQTMITYSNNDCMYWTSSHILKRDSDVAD